VRWQRRCRDDLIWADFNDQFVVFHRSSGQTHFLNESAAVLLIDVLASPATLDEAARTLLGDLDQTPIPGAPSREMRERVLRMLVRFEELGLVQRVADA
jgi:PqqD family protein of HPr-rel-A system